jgi:hypothetical protein
MGAQDPHGFHKWWSSMTTGWFGVPWVRKSPSTVRLHRSNPRIPSPSSPLPVAKCQDGHQNRWDLTLLGLGCWGSLKKLWFVIVNLCCMMLYVVPCSYILILNLGSFVLIINGISFGFHSAGSSVDPMLQLRVYPHYCVLKVRIVHSWAAGNCGTSMSFIVAEACLSCWNSPGNLQMWPKYPKSVETWSCFEPKNTALVHAIPTSKQQMHHVWVWTCAAQSANHDPTI